MKKLLFQFAVNTLLTQFLFGQLDIVYPNNNLVQNKNSVVFEWNKYPNANSYQIQLAYDNNFTQNIIDSNLTSLNIQVLNIPSNQQLFWRCKANNSSWSEIRSLSVIDYRSWPELEIWLDADSISPISGNKINEWYDLSNNSNHFSQLNSLNQPKLIDSVNEFNNHNTVSFIGSQSSFLGGVDLSHLTEGEIFSIQSIENLTSSQNERGIWNFGTSSQSDVYPWIDNNAYIGFGRNNRFNIGNILNQINLGMPHILNVRSGTDFALEVNNTSVFNSSDGSPSFSSTIYIGKSLGNYYFNGSMSEVILFNDVLNDSLRFLVNSYLRHKYAPPVNLGRNISYSLCDSVLYAGKHFTSYNWSDGSTADSLVVSNSGTYWVEVEDVFGNISSDTIEVVLPSFQHPTSQLYCPSEFIDWQTGLGEHYNYLWSDGSTADSLVINSPGSYHVTVTDTNGCVFQSDTLTFQEDLFALSASLGADLELCSGNTLALVSGAEEAVSYLWNTGSINPSIGIENSGVYSVEVINANGCVAQDTVSVTIIGDAPVLDLTFPEIACKNAAFYFQDQSTTTDGSTLSSWTWELGDGNALFSPSDTHLYTEDGIYDVNYTVGTTAGCFMDTTFHVEVKNNPILTFSSSGVCQGDEIQFYGGQLTPFLISDWTWDFGDASASISGQNVIHNYTAHGEFEVQLIGTDVYGCKDTVNTSKLISPLPEVMFSYNEICEGKVVNFQNQTTIASPSAISSYFWNFGDGTTSGQTNPQKPYITYGEYTISLTAVNEEGCSASKSNLLKVHATPAVDYAIEQTCSGLSTVLKDESFVPDGSVAQVDWSINGAAPLSGFSLEKTYDYPGTYQLKQTVKSAFGCSNSKESLFEIHEALKADFSFYPNAFIVGETTVFVNETQGGSAVQWTFGGFATAQQDTSLVFTEEQIGEEITVQLWVENENGCVDSVSVTREVVSRETDLLISEIFTQEVDGFLTIGVRLKNEGATPIENVELTLQKSGNILLKEIWTGELQANEEEVYVFSAALSSFIAMEDSLSQYICIRGRIINSSFQETDLSNNEFCRTLNTSQSIIIQPYPNPVRTQLTIRLLMPFEENGSLMMYDNYGRLVKNVFENKKLEVGLNSIEVDVSQIASGKYSIVYRGERQVQIANVVVAN